MQQSGFVCIELITPFSRVYLQYHDVGKHFGCKSLQDNNSCVSNLGYFLVIVKDQHLRGVNPVVASIICGQPLHDWNTGRVVHWAFQSNE